jgi:hypothetical protein
VTDYATLKAWLDGQERRLKEVHSWSCSASIHCVLPRQCEEREQSLEPVNGLRAVLDKVLDAVEPASAPAGEKPLMVKRLLPEGMLIPGELLLDAGVELPADAPADALYRVVWGQSG